MVATMQVTSTSWTTTGCASSTGSGIPARCGTRSGLSGPRTDAPRDCLVSCPRMKFCVLPLLSRRDSLREVLTAPSPLMVNWTNCSSSSCPNSKFWASDDVSSRHRHFAHNHFWLEMEAAGVLPSSTSDASPKQALLSLLTINGMHGQFILFINSTLILRSGLV